MSRSRNRPPRLEPHVDTTQPAAPLTPGEALLRAKVSGPSGSGPGPAELRRKIERMTMADRRAFGELAPIAGLTVGDVWSAVTTTFGAGETAAVVDAERTIAATSRAVAQVRVVAARGGRIALATSVPGSLLALHLAFARLGRDAGAEVVDLADVGPIRSDGRTSRWLRWVGGVAVVSDGAALCDARNGEAAREWIFAISRPALVVADGAFAEVAWEAGMQVVALCGLDRPALAVAGARSGRCTIVPMHTDRSPRSYRPIEDLIARTEIDLAGGPPGDPCGPAPAPGM